MRMVMVVVRTAAILSIVSGERFIGERGSPELPGDNGPDGVIGAGWFDDEPEQDVGNVDDPDGLSLRGESMKCDREQGKKRTNAVEVEAITEHQLPNSQRLDLQGLDGTKKGEAELNMTGERQGWYWQGFERG